MVPLPDFLTIPEAATWVGLHPQSLHNAIYNGVLPVHRPSPGTGRRNRVLLLKADVQAWMDARAERRARQEQVRQERHIRNAEKRLAAATREPGPGTNAGCQRHSVQWGELLRTTRERLSLTIAEVGRQAGICQSYVSRMESLGEIPRREKVVAIAGALQVEPSVLLVLCGYAPEPTTPLARLLHSLLTLPPGEQTQAAEVTEAYLQGSQRQRQEFLALAGGGTELARSGRVTETRPQQGVLAW